MWRERCLQQAFVFKLINRDLLSFVISAMEKRSVFIAHFFRKCDSWPPK